MRENIKDHTQEFLRAYGYIAKSTEENAVLFSRPTGLGVADELLVYFHESGEESTIESKLGSLSKKFAKIPSGDEGRRFFLSPMPLGLVPKAVTENGFKYQVPVWFFDREFSADKRSPLKQLEGDIARYEEGRVEQPFRTNKSEGKDLLSSILQELKNPGEPCIRLIVAPAGYGKTVLMANLYARLKDSFIKSKKEQRSGMRPLLMLPGHMKQSIDLESLINNFIGDEYDYGVSNLGAFRFWVKKNYVVWLLDGLEELILKIPDRFLETLLEEYIYAPHSYSPQIIIAIRKPMLATSPELRESIEEWEENGLKSYELCDWGQEQKNIYFQKNLKLGQQGTEKFLQDIVKSASLQQICTVPYYCSLVAELKNSGEFQVFNDDCELVGFALHKLCEREFGKGLDRDILPVDTQIDLFMDLCAESFENKKISRALLMDYAELYLYNIAPEVMKYQIECLQRHALLTQLGEEIDFVHDIITQYLIGKYLLSQFKLVKPEALKGSELEKDSLIIKYIQKSSNDINWREVIQKTLMLPSSRADAAIGFRNVIKIVLASPIIGKEDLIRDGLQNRNLSGLEFKNISLKGAQFSNSKLADVEFIDCDLTDVNFDGCHFKNTSFNRGCKMKGATTRGAILEVVKTDGKVLDDEREIGKFFYEITQVPAESRGPCQAVINIMRVLNKIVKKGRGYVMPKKFLVQTKCGGGIPAIRCLEVSIKHGIISDFGDSVKVKINVFEVVEQLIKNQKIRNNNIKEMLDEICRDKSIGCQHSYR